MPDLPEREKQYDVNDRPAERGIRVNNVLTSGILTILAWVGYNIDNMKDSLAQVQVNDATITNEIKHINESFAQHKIECDKKFEQLGIK